MPASGCLSHPAFLPDLGRVTRSLRTLEPGLAPGSAPGEG